MKKRMVMASLLCALVFMCGCSSNRILSPLSTSNTTKYTANYNITMQFTQNPDAKEAPLYTAVSYTHLDVYKRQMQYHL